MFRNPRENVGLPPERKAPPSTGRPPSPPAFSTAPSSHFAVHPMATKAKTAPQKSSVTPKTSKTKIKPNGNIQAFFKKAEELNSALFVPNRFNESIGSVKRRRTEELDNETVDLDLVQDAGTRSPPPTPSYPERSKVEEGTAIFVEEKVHRSSGDKIRKRTGPFVDDSDSDESEDNDLPPPLVHSFSGGANSMEPLENNAQSYTISTKSEMDNNVTVPESRKPEVVFPAIPTLKHETTSYSAAGDFEGFENLEDFADEFEDGDEFRERRYMEEQRRLELDNDEFGSKFDGEDIEALDEFTDIKWRSNTEDKSAPTCPICSIALSRVTDEQASVHVNNCLDGNPTPLPVQDLDSKDANKTSARKLPLVQRPAKPPQQNPFTMAAPSASGPASAFTKLMANHSEELAWKSAAAAEVKARGKPAYERTCPFYKILPGFSICVDAFRYGPVEGCKAYFLSHFHSDHYIGLTSTWCNGPIYCSRVTGNLVRQQLRVDPKWVMDLEFEKEVDIPGTDGARVTMISANHCPGSSLFLFEKAMSKGKNAKVQRILHCGDFRACRAHIEHPLLRPDVVDKVSGQTKEQKIDVCYLDTTYLNPKYAFPPQEHVIQACANMCVSLHKSCPDETDKWESMKRERAGTGMTQFLQGTVEKQDTHMNNIPRGRLLVIVGTYSIGKERICVGIAKALNSKIYAPAGKQRICACLEDPELDALLTKDPREAQVHMTPLFEIRPETLDEYLNDYRDTFSRVVGFRPSGWNYRPPNSRFIESPPVSTVLYGANWKSAYTLKDLVPQRGSTKKASCFGVPYSEHSSFRELTVFCCSLRIEKVIPTVNVGSAKSRQGMSKWVDRWAAERKKAGLFVAEEF